MTARPHDALFKETFSDLANARGELVSVLPANISVLVDWDTLRLEPGTFVDEALRETITDLLFSVQMCGREARLYLLFEHQSAPHPLMPLRALAYVVRIWEAWLRGKSAAKKIPPVIPVMLSQVEGGWRGATDLLSIVDFADAREREQLAPLHPQCVVLLDDLARTSDDVLDARPMPEAAKLLLAALRDVRSAEDVVALAPGWARWIPAVRAGSRGEATLMTLVRYILEVRASVDWPAMTAAIGAIDPAAGEVFMSAAEKLIQQGEARGEARGETRGRAEMLLKLLVVRFGSVPAAVKERVAQADIATLDRWAERVLTAASIDDVLAG